MKKILVHVGLAMAVILPAATAMAEYPDKPIELVVGFEPGGGTDVMARTVAPFVEKYLGNGASVVVKNVPGASGQIAVTQVAHARPDGYTLGTYNLPGMMARTLDRKTDYTADSFTFIANIVNDPNVIVTQKGSGLKTIAEVIAAAKAKPGAVTVGMSSLGGDDHFALTKLQTLTHAEFTIVPFKGTAPARTAVIGGHVTMGIMNISEVAAFKDQINILGIAKDSRSEFAPEVPTFKEQGINLINGSQRGFVAPAGLPPEVKAKLLDAFRKAAADPKLLAALKATANPAEVVVGDDFRKLNAETLDLAKEVWKATPWK